MYRYALPILVAGSVLFAVRESAAAPPRPVVQFATDIHHDLSAPLREMAGAAAAAPRKPHPLGAVAIAPSVRQGDGALQARAPIPFAPTIVLNFDGLGMNRHEFTPDSVPPDPTGAAGDTQFVQWVNSSFAVFDKSNGDLLLGPLAGNTLWAGFGGPCEKRNDGDPIVNYDKEADRWVLSQYTDAPPYMECVAVSQTSDATGAFFRYAFPMGANFADYPRMGIWPDAYYFSFHMFWGQTELGGKACAFDREAMLAGRSAQQECFDVSGAGAMVVSDWDGADPPPEGSPNYFLDLGTNSLKVYSFYTDFANPANASLDGPVTVAVASFTPACNHEEPGPVAAQDPDSKVHPGQKCVPETGGSKLDAISDRLMYRAAYRNLGDHESLLVTHTVARRVQGKFPIGAAVRWYELRDLASGTPTVFQQGSFAPDARWRWMSSIGMDKAGDIAVGYSISGPNIRPWIGVSGREPSDPAGQLEKEFIVVRSGAAQKRESRWGDYSAMSIDPADDCTFWYTTEYIAKPHADDNWNTRIVSFKFPGCS